jgi:hypothetical protein
MDDVLHYKSLITCIGDRCGKANVLNSHLAPQLPIVEA